MNTGNDSPYIERVKITGLCGSDIFDWRLSKGVNILCGANGSGKSTMIESIHSLFSGEASGNKSGKAYDKVEVFFDNGEKVSSDDSEEAVGRYNIDIIDESGLSLRLPETVQEATDDRMLSDQDRKMHYLQNRYLSAQPAREHRVLFFDIIDSLFRETGKTIVREDGGLMFRCKDVDLTPYQLSAGEKRMLVMLTTVLLQDNAPYVMLMDEPEISLHFNWQKTLIQTIISLNPNVQLILATHSPAIIMDGWVDKVIDISDLIINN